jgi:hypothetical protein
MVIFDRKGWRECFCCCARMGEGSMRWKWIEERRWGAL